jgi:hypothetical protein
MLPVNADVPLVAIPDAAPPGIDPHKFKGPRGDCCQYMAERRYLCRGPCSAVTIGATATRAGGVVFRTHASNIVALTILA